MDTVTAVFCNHHAEIRDTAENSIPKMRVGALWPKLATLEVIFFSCELAALVV